MPTFTVTEYDETNPEYGYGAFIFELSSRAGRAYAIRKDNGNYVHLNGKFQVVYLNASERARRENIVRAYMLTRPDSFKIVPQAERCAYFKALDVEFGTSKDSPLHHNNRCETCKKGLSS